MAKEKQAVDHREEALSELGMAVDATTGADAQAFALCAQTHATLAVAEELRGILEQLGSGVLVIDGGRG